MVFICGANHGKAEKAELDLNIFSASSLELVIDSEQNLFALSISNLTAVYKLGTSTLV